MDLFSSERGLEKIHLLTLFGAGVSAWRRRQKTIQPHSDADAVLDPAAVPKTTSLRTVKYITLGCLLATSLLRPSLPYILYNIAFHPEPSNISTMDSVKWQLNLVSVMLECFAMSIQSSNIQVIYCVATSTTTLRKERSRIHLANHHRTIPILMWAFFVAAQLANAARLPNLWQDSFEKSMESVKIKPGYELLFTGLQTVLFGVLCGILCFAPRKPLGSTNDLQHVHL